MKAQAFMKEEPIEFLNLKTVFAAVLVLMLLFMIIYMRHLCIKTGYEISRVSQKLESKNIEYQQLMVKRAEVLNVRMMFEKGQNLGMEFPDPSRVYNVK